MSFYGAPKKHMSFRELLRESRKEYSASVFENEVWSDVEIPTKLMSAEMNSMELGDPNPIIQGVSIEKVLWNDILKSSYEISSVQRGPYYNNIEYTGLTCTGPRFSRTTNFSQKIVHLSLNYATNHVTWPTHTTIK